MESLRHQEGDSRDVRTGVAEGLSGTAYVPASVCELTLRQLELQRRLVRESLLLRPA
jgi:hypothetical protein